MWPAAIATMSRNGAVSPQCSGRTLARSTGGSIASSQASRAAENHASISRTYPSLASIVSRKPRGQSMCSHDRGGSSNAYEWYTWVQPTVCLVKPRIER